MYASEKIFKRALLVSIAAHGVLLFVLEKNITGSKTLDMPDFSPMKVSLFVPEVPVPATPESLPLPSLPEPDKVAPEPVETPPVSEAPGTDPPVEMVPADSAQPVETDILEPAVPAIEDPVPPAAETAGTGEAAEVPTETQAPPVYAGIKLEKIDLNGARMPVPAYPSQAKRMEWEGDVTVSFVINHKGRVESICVEDSSGYDVLDDTVVKTVEKAWRFPKRDEDIRVWKTFSFRLIS